MQNDPTLPLMDNGKGADLRAGPVAPRRAGTVSRWKRWWVLPMFVVLVTAAAVGTYLVAGRAPEPVATPEPASPSTVTALGRLMPEGDVVRLAPPFGAGEARVARLLVNVGDQVEEGRPIVELDSLPQYQAALSIAQANLASKEAGLVQTRAAVAAAQTEARASRDRAASAAALTKAEAERERMLVAQGAAAKAALDRAEAMAVQAARELDRADAQLARHKGGEAQPDVALAARELGVARAELARAESDLARGRVLSPVAGRILALHVRAGEKPGSDGIATLGATERMEAELEVYQTDISRVARGQRTTLTSPALAEPLTGIVTEIGLEVERQTVLAADPAANTDAHIVRVTVTLDAASAQRAAALTGLEVTARIETGPLRTRAAP